MYIEKKKKNLTHNFRKGGRSLLCPAGSAAGGWQQPDNLNGSHCRWQGSSPRLERSWGEGARPSLGINPLLPSLSASEDDSEVGEARRMPFSARAWTENRLTLCQDKRRLSGWIRITNIPNPGPLARFPHETAGSPQRGLLGRGQGLHGQLTPLTCLEGSP